MLEAQERTLKWVLGRGIGFEEGMGVVDSPSPTTPHPLLSIQKLEKLDWQCLVLQPDGAPSKYLPYFESVVVGEEGLRRRRRVVTL